MTILYRKLCFLAKLLSKKSDSNSYRIFYTLASKGDISDISIVRQCKELELLFGTKLLDSVLASPEDAICTPREVKSCLIEADWKRTISMASAHPSLAYEWLALWDCALDYGTLGTKVSHTVFKIMCKPVFGDYMLLLFKHHR